MKAYVGTFRVRTGLGTQTVTGVVDRTGTPFTPEHLFFLHGSSVLETLHTATPGSTETSASVNLNYYRAADSAAGFAAIADYHFSTTQYTSGAAGTGVVAALDALYAQAFGGGVIYRQAQITAVAVGGFTLNVTTETFAVATDVLVLALAATDGDLHLAQIGASGTTTVPFSFAPTGVLNPKVPPIAATGSIATGAGGAGGWGLGWDSSRGGPSSLQVVIGALGTQNQTYQSHVSFDNGIDDPPVARDTYHVTAWGAASLTLSGPPVTGTNAHAVGGVGIVTASGTVQQPLTAGHQVVPLGIDARVVWVMSGGQPPSTVLQTGPVQACVAWTDGARRGALWVGESSTVPPLLGADYLSQTSLLRFASAGAQGASTVFTAVADLVSLERDGTLTIDWTATDGVARELLWFAIGTPPPPPIPPPPPGAIEPIRRLRQAPVLWDGAEGKRLKFPGFELLTEAGGPRDTDVAMPIVLQWSDDGGHSWGHEHRNEGARIGEHRYRYRWLRLGQARNRVFRVVCSADAKVVFIDALLSPDPVQGSS